MICLLVTMIGAQAQKYDYKTVAGDLTQTRIYTLSNGLKVYLSVNKEKPRIQCNIAVRTGSRNDPAETTGLAHYLEHLMFKGTKSFGTNDAVAEAPLLDSIQNRYEMYRHIIDPAQRKACYHKIDSLSQVAAKYFIPNEYDKLMATIGSEGSNAYTSNDVTCYVENIPSNEIENWAKIQSDRFQNMVIRGFHTELEAVYEEYNIGLANDGEKEYVALSKKLFPSHPYGTQTTIGTQEHLKNPSILNIKNYFHKYYVPNNVAICMAGDFDPDQVMSIIDKYFGSWKKSDNLSYPQFGPQPKITAPIDTTVVGQEAENVMMGWRFNKASDLQCDTLEVISKMLANGKAGLFEIDLEQKMLALSVGAYNENMNDYSMFCIYGMPKANQTLEELRGLIIKELDKFKKGDFSDDLLPSVINNQKLNYFRSLDYNDNRASYMVNAFIDGQQWSDVVNKINRQSKMTKQQIVDFANKYLNDNFVCVYKKLGTDSTQKKIDKPVITPIPANRDMASNFLNNIKNSKVMPITPRFVDFKKDLTITKTSKNLPLLYKQNTSDGLFTLAFAYNTGEEANLKQTYAANYLEYVGTNKKSVSQIKQEFYKLACDYGVNVGTDQTFIYLTGLNENLPKALALLEDYLQNAKGDKDSYSKYIDLVMKSRQDSKKDQSSNFGRLSTYGIYGAYNPARNVLSEQQLRSLNPQDLLSELRKYSGLEQTVLYYGPSTQKQLDELLLKEHKTAKVLTKAPEGKEYVKQTTPKNEVFLAPYDAKNIYMQMYHNENKPWNPEEAPVKAVFNEYFGGGMNTIVFQELREARGLAYSAYANYETPSKKNKPEDFYTYIISQNDKMMDCIKVFNNILDTVPQSQSAFDIAKQSLTKSLQSMRVTKFEVLNKYYGAMRLGINYDINERIYNALPSITLTDMVNFEKKNIANKTYKYLILGDEKNLDIKALERIAPIKRLSTEDIFGY